MDISSEEYRKRIEQEITQIGNVIKAHQLLPKKPSKAFRKAEHNNLFFTHPLWCATTILFEPTLPYELKRKGYLALLYHDVLEDTTQQLLNNLEPEVVTYIKELTVEGGSKEEIKTIWDKPKEIRLFKLYDKVSNYMDDRWLTDDKKRIFYENYIKQLTKDVEQQYGNLRIVQIAKAILHNT